MVLTISVDVDFLKKLKAIETTDLILMTLLMSMKKIMVMTIMDEFCDKVSQWNAQKRKKSCWGKTCLLVVGDKATPISNISIKKIYGNDNHELVLWYNFPNEMLKKERNLLKGKIFVSDWWQRNTQCSKFRTKYFRIKTVFRIHKFYHRQICIVSLFFDKGMKEKNSNFLL